MKRSSPASRAGGAPPWASSSPRASTATAASWPTLASTAPTSPAPPSWALAGAILTGIDTTRLSLPPSALAGAVVDPTPEARAMVGHIRQELDRAHDWITAGGTPARLDRMDLRPAAELFQGRLLAGLHAREVTGIGVDFSFAKLQGANFEGADLRGATFVGADLRGANFRGANLAHAFFSEAELGELELKPGLALPTRFDDAVLVGTGLPAPEPTAPAEGQGAPEG